MLHIKLKRSFLLIQIQSQGVIISPSILNMFETMENLYPRLRMYNFFKIPCLPSLKPTDAKY